MMNGEVTFWSSGIWLVPVILLAIMVGLFFLVRHWQKQTQENLKELRLALRQLQRRRRDLVGRLQAYAAGGGEPYASRIAALQTQLEAITSQIETLERQHVAIHEARRRLGSNRWQATVGAPFLWYNLRRDLADLRRGRKDLDTTLQTAESSAKLLERLPLEVADQAKQVLAKQQQVRRRIEALQEDNVYGEQLAAAISQFEQVQAELAELPAYLAQGDEQEILTQANQEEVAAAHALLNEALPALDQLSGQLQAWQRQHGEATSKVYRMRQALNVAERAFENIPPQVNLDELETQLEHVKVIANSLEATLAHLEIEQIPNVIAETAKVQTSLVEMEALIRQAPEQSAKLVELLPVLNADIKQLSAKLASLGTAEIHPLAWNQSRDRLTKLSRQATALGSARKVRTPQQLAVDLETAQKLENEQKELAQHIANVEQGHAELVALLGSSELDQGDEWLQDTQDLVERVGQYDPENWPRPNTLASLPEELHAFSDGLQYLVSDDQAVPIQENDLEKRLDETRQLVKYAGALRRRVDSIRERLRQIQESESTTLDRLEADRSALSQLASLVRSNAFLQQVAGQEVTRLQSSLDGLRSDLEQRQRGAVEKKARLAELLTNRIESSTSSWLAQIGKEVDQMKQELGGRIAALDAIAELDEPAVAKAKQALAAGQGLGAISTRDAQTKPLKEAILALRQTSDFWQEAAAAIKQLDDVSGTLIETYEVAVHNRKLAKEQFAEVFAWLRGARGWPPTSINLNAERQEINRLEAQWEAMHQQPKRAIDLVVTLSKLAGGYQSLGERLSQAAGRAEEEQNRFASLEAELEEMLALWQKQRTVYSQNDQVTEEIDKLLNGIDSERSLLKRHYGQGTRSYEQLYTAMQALHRRARLTQVTVDEHHAIDVNGRVIAYS